MTVWIVHETWHGGIEGVKGVFSTRESAQQSVKERLWEHKIEFEIRGNFYHWSDGYCRIGAHEVQE